MSQARIVVAVCAVMNLVPLACVAMTFTVTDLGTLGGSQSFATAVNSAGKVVGYSYPPGDSSYHAFLYDGVMHDLGTFGGTTSEAYGINDKGQVSGSALTSGNASGRAFLYDGVMHDLGTLGGLSSSGYGINSNGVVTGHANANSGTHAFVYDGTMHDLGTLGGSVSIGYGINSNGWVTGDSYPFGDSGYRAFLYDGTMHDLGTLGGATADAFGINEKGQVVGRADRNLGWHAFLYDGTMHDLGSLGGLYSSAFGINAGGQVTGWSTVLGNNSAQHAFLYDIIHGMVDLNSEISSTSGWVLQWGYAINDSGQVVGQGLIGGQMHGFLLTPVPEPSTFILLAFGSVAVCFYVRRTAIRQHQSCLTMRRTWRSLEI